MRQVLGISILGALIVVGLGAGDGAYARSIPWPEPSGAERQEAASRAASGSAALLPKTTVGDPENDTIGVGAVQLDISSFTAVTDGIDLTLSLDFFTSISPADSGDPDAVVGYIELDVDRDDTTGVGSIVSLFCPDPSDLGIEFLVALSEADSTAGTVPVRDADTFASVGDGSITYGPQSLTVVFPLSFIGSADGIVDTASVIGTQAEPTDCVPNGGFLTSSLISAPSVLEIPTLGVWGLAALAALLALSAVAWLRFGALR